MRLTFGIATALGLVCASQAALAADLPVKARPMPPAMVLYNWSGFYIGGHAGWAWADTDWTFFSGTVFEDFSQRDSGWVGGGQAGYMHQWGRWVLGVEVSYSALDLESTSAALLVANRSRTSQIDDLLHVTARLGYAWDRFLGYVKGGYANAEVRFDTFVTSTGLPTTSSSDREDGWTVGTGFEYAVTPHVRLGAEYNFTRLDISDRNQFVFPGFAVPETVTNASSDIHTITGRINFSFAPFWR
jgi:outer membrane immunogenic protein